MYLKIVELNENYWSVGLGRRTQSTSLGMLNEIKTYTLYSWFKSAKLE
jgi:hypothetical protein